MSGCTGQARSPSRSAGPNRPSSLLIRRHLVGDVVVWDSWATVGRGGLAWSQEGGRPITQQIECPLDAAAHYALLEPL